MNKTATPSMFELSPADSRKSFYGKAKVVFSNDIYTLYSYDTPVATIDLNGNFRMIWGGYSLTTARHVRAFKVYFGIDE